MAETGKIERPTSARVYDYALGGEGHADADRETVDELMESLPELPAVFAANRAFLRRAVRYCVSSGIRQFLDLGAGIPTEGNTHEIAQQIDASARVVYVDIDPLAVTRHREILAGNPHATAIEADLRHPAAVLANPEVTAVLDLSQPMVVMLLSVLHFLPDADNPAAITAQLRQAMAPGSHLVLSHGSTEGTKLDGLAGAMDTYAAAQMPLHMRPLAEIANMFNGFNLVDPGLVRLPSWRPDAQDPDAFTDTPTRFPGFAGIGVR